MNKAGASLFSQSELVPPWLYYLSKVHFPLTLYQGHRRHVHSICGSVRAGSVGTVDSESYRIRLNNKINAQDKHIRYNKNK